MKLAKIHKSSWNWLFFKY